MSATLVQTATAFTSTSASSKAVSIPGATTAGNVLVATISNTSGTSNSVSSVSDAYSNTWTKRLSNAGGSGVHADLEIWDCVLGAGQAGASHWVSANLGSSQSIAIAVEEWSGLDTTNLFDRSANNNGISSTAIDSGLPSATQQADDLIIGGAGTATSGETYTLGTGFSNLVTCEATNAGNKANVAMEHKVVSSISQYNATFTLSTAANWNAGVVAYRIAGGGGGGGARSKGGDMLPVFF